MQNKTGFTLVEMLTVVMIISILTAVVLPQYRRAIQKAQSTEAVAMLRTINDSGERLASEFGYRTFQSFSSAEPSKATFQRMDMFDESTISCTFDNTYTEMTCEHFKYFLNQGGAYAYAQKRTSPYQDTEIRLSRADIPQLSCVDSNKQPGGCDVYNL